MSRVRVKNKMYGKKRLRAKYYYYETLPSTDPTVREFRIEEKIKEACPSPLYFVS